jgi:rhodanese-related sulfurtransferase
VNYKRLVGSILVIVILCGALVSCGAPASGGGTSEFEVIRQAADAYLSSGKAEQLAMSADLHAVITDNDPKNDPRILEIRNFAKYLLGHICEAVDVPWHQLFLTLTPDSFDIYFSDHDKTSDVKKIVLYSYTGQEGAGVTVPALNMMGFDVISLKWGYNQWQFCPNASPGAFFEASSGLQKVVTDPTLSSFETGFGAVGMNFPTETTTNETTKTYRYPVINNTKSTDPFEIIRTSAANYAQKEIPLPPEREELGGHEQVHFFWATDIIPSDLFDLLNDSNNRNDPFILSVQPKELYDKGHVPGSVWMPITDVCKPENLSKLPPDRKIVVVSNDGQSGSQVSGILNLLGYDAVNLQFGMTGWTYSDDIAPGRFHVWEADFVTFKDVLSYEVCWIETPTGNMLPSIEGWTAPTYAPEVESRDNPSAGD